jgi:hypothetical protein
LGLPAVPADGMGTMGIGLGEFYPNIAQKVRLVNYVDSSRDIYIMYYVLYNI